MLHCAPSTPSRASRSVENYFNYFTEIEERFQRRRGSILLLSTLDWALIETWKDAGIPLEAVLRGIDESFDSYDAKPLRAKTKKVNSLAYCAQEVLSAAQEMQEAAVGTSRKPAADAGFEKPEVSAYLERNANSLEAAQVSADIRKITQEIVQSLRRLAGDLPPLEDLERNLTVLEEKLFAALLTHTAESELVEIRGEADRDIAPYRSKMIGAQIEQLHRQYVNKRLLERAKLPRLSLFYM
jgi:hypothetical protein